MERYSFKDFFVGQVYEKKLTVSKEDGKKFADISHDHNPIHLDEEFAKESRFGKNIVHGMLIGSYFSGIIGNEFPGAGSVYISQDIFFRRPVFYDMEVTLRIEVIEINNEKHHLKLATQCFGGDELLVDGKAKILFE